MANSESPIVAQMVARKWVSFPRLLFVLAFVVAGSVTLWANAPAAKDKDLQAVAALVKTKVNETLVVLRNKDIKKEKRIEKVKAIVEPLFNFELMAKLSLGKKHWKNFSKEQRDEFTKLFIVQLQDSYIEKIELFTDETVEFAETYKSKGKYVSPTTVLSKEKRYEVIYKIYKKSDKYWVYDLEIEGISIVHSFGMQYDQFLATGDAKGLIEKMKAKSMGSPDAFKEKTTKTESAKDKG